MPRKRMRLILQRNFAIAKKSREKLHRQNLFTKLVASLNKHGSIKSDISERALSSDATEENAQLKRQLSDLQTEYHEKLSKLENENDSLKESCRVLCNRCFTLTRGVTCLFCGLDYPCPHMPGLEEQVAMAHKLRKEIEKNG